MITMPPITTIHRMSDTAIPEKRPSKKSPKNHPDILITSDSNGNVNVNSRTIKNANATNLRMSPIAVSF